MLKIRTVLLISCAFAISFGVAASTRESDLLFDPTHGVILSGPEGKAIAEACGGTSTAARSTLTPIDIGRVERQLAPLLAEDLQNSGSTAVPREYYRQYASGYLGSRSAIFVNGFHESPFLSSGKESN